MELINILLIICPIILLCLIVQVCMAYYRYRHHYTYDKFFPNSPKFLDYWKIIDHCYWNEDYRYAQPKDIRFGLIGGYGIYPKYRNKNAVASLNLERKIICSYLLKQKFDIDLIGLILSYLYDDENYNDGDYEN
jgi:hypothetical protein